MRRAIPLAIAVGLLLAAGWRDLHQRDQLETRFQADPAKQVVLLSAVWCGFCDQARSFLQRNEVRFAEYDVEQSREGRLAYSELGRGAIPIVMVDGAAIRGVDVAAWVEALGPEPGTSGSVSSSRPPH